MNVIDYHITQDSLFKDYDKFISKFKEFISTPEIPKTDLELHIRNPWNRCISELRMSRVLRATRVQLIYTMWFPLEVWAATSWSSSLIVLQRTVYVNRTFTFSKYRNL